MLTLHVDGCPVRLRTPHDLPFTARWGTVFTVLDEQDSGNLCLGIEGPAGRVFVKFAGARTLRYDGDPAAAVEAARHAAKVYRALDHPTLVRLREAVDVASGLALVFAWTDALPVGRMYGRSPVPNLDPAICSDAVQQVYDLHEHVAGLGWVPVDLYDGSVMIDPVTGQVVVCDIDLYQRAPLINTMGRMWGSGRFMAPEEHQLGAVIDEVTTVVALGTLAHTFLGDDATRSPAAWRGSPEQLAVAQRAVQPDRGTRWPNVAALADAWRHASRP